MFATDDAWQCHSWRIISRHTSTLLPAGASSRHDIVHVCPHIRCASPQDSYRSVLASCWSCSSPSSCHDWRTGGARYVRASCQAWFAKLVITWFLFMIVAALLKQRLRIESWGSSITLSRNWWDCHYRSNNSMGNASPILFFSLKNANQICCFLTSSGCSTYDHL